MDCVWKARKFQAPPCLNDTGCLSVCLLFFSFFFCKAHQPPAAAVTHMRTDKALNATFEDERQLDAMQISAFIWDCVCDSLTKACQRFSLPSAVFLFIFFVSWGTRCFCCCKCSTVANGYCEDATKTAYDFNMFETNSFWSQRVVIVAPFNQSEIFWWFCAAPNRKWDAGHA